MSNSFQYRDSWYSLATPWLSTGTAEKYMYTMQLATDLLLEKMNQAIKIRLPGQGDPSQLPYLAHDRGLVQGPAEPNASLVARLQNSFAAWGLAGSARAVLEQLQAYMQNLQPGVPSSYPLATIVSSTPTRTNWSQLYQGDALGALPTVTTVRPANFSWSANEGTWWSWLILPMALVPAAQSGTNSALMASAAGGSFTSPGQNVGGVWVPTTSGTTVNAPFVTVAGLSGLTSANVGQWITFSKAHTITSNIGTYQIVQVISPSSCVVANPNNSLPDATAYDWAIAEYPWIGPGLPWGSPGVVFGQGELVIPPVDTGSNFRGTWGPSSADQTVSNGPTISWGLDVRAAVIQSLRGIVQRWKSGGTYYRNIVVAFDCGNGTAGNAYSPNSSEGSGNPDGSFGSVGKNVGGIWVPTRVILSTADCYCQGTGSHQSCSEENVS